MTKDIPGFPEYYIDTEGNVYNKRSNKILHPYVSPSGYANVYLYKNKQKKGMRINRLVAITFLDNPNNYPSVNHIDGNKLNNNIANLEWCTYSYNNQHAYDTGLHKRNKCRGFDGAPPRSVIRDDGVIYATVSEAAIANGTQATNISKCIRGIYKTSGGHTWSYYEEVV